MWPNPQETDDLATFAEETLNGKLHFFCSDMRKGRDMFKSRKSLKKPESEGRSQTAEPKGGELPYVQQH